MSRRRRADKRELVPDPRYSSPLVTQLVNIVMLQGKKSRAQNIVYGAFEKVSEKVGKGDRWTCSWARWKTPARSWR
jgi:small subunit ribosomal protein S7